MRSRKGTAWGGKGGGSGKREEAQDHQLFRADVRVRKNWGLPARGDERSRGTMAAPYTKIMLSDE